MVIETATISETELGAYCRDKELYPEQIQQWKAAFLEGAGRQEEQEKAAKKQRKEDRKTIEQLKAEVRRLSPPKCKPDWKFPCIILA
ncbi:hypothetical protein [Vreelandella alkaliphila]|uniref:Transposase n=1 Tax=Vreelandella alkaliphila TaxID=272774 RepID=A0ABX4HKW9_9GAMM|nr:hypothetical protein [Halomonas humidisoli]PAU72998.1 hypothetical protein CK497_07755 [Halomonas humidisoli]